MKKIIRKYINPLKKFSFITISNFATQLIAVIGFTFVARVFAPNIIGEYVVYLSFVSIISLFSTGFYEQALFIDTDENNRRHIILLTLIISIFITILSLFFLKVFSIVYWVPISIAVLGSAIRVIARSIAIVNNRLVFMSLYSLVIAPSVPVTILIGAHFFSQESHWFLIRVNAGITLLSSLIFLIVLSFNDVKKYNSIQLSKIWWFAKRYKKLPQYKMTGEVTNALSVRAPTIVISNFFTTSLSAFYGMAFRIAVTPLTVVVGTISQMFLQELVSQKKYGAVKLSLLKKYTAVLLTIALIVTVLIFTVSEPVITLVFSAEYAMVSEFIKYMSPYIFVLILVSPLTSVFVVFEKQKYLLYQNAVSLIITIIAYSIAIRSSNLLWGVGLFSIGVFVLYLYMFLIILKLFKEWNSKI